MLLHTADWHLGKQIETVDMLPDQWDWFMRFCDDLKARSPELILIAGDLFDYNADRIEARKLFDAILTRLTTEIGCPIAVIPGNHDDNRWLKACFLPYERCLTFFDQPDAPAKPYTVDGKSILLHPIPFWSSKAMKKYGVKTVTEAMELRLKQIKSQMQPGIFHVAMAHGLILPKGDESVERILKANKDSGNDLVDSALFAAFDYTALGHIHANLYAGNHCYYAGTPFVYERKEIGQQKGYCSVSFSEQGVSVQHHTLPPVRPVKLLYSNLTEIEKSPPEWAKDAYVFLQLEDTVPVKDGMQRMRQIFPHLVQMRYEKEPAPVWFDLHQPLIEQFSVFLHRVGESVLIKEDFIMKHIIPNYTFPSDPHTVIANPDLTALENAYADTKVYYGDFHAHSNSGGTSDGKTTPEEWLDAMPKIGLDFIGLMDHRQVRHMYLDSFTTKHFLCGSEPAGFWNEPYLECHYLMLFPKPGMLEPILEQFPELFDFKGDQLTGHFEYIRMDFADFLKIKDAVMAAGGMFVNAHPKQQIKSERVEDFFFGDGTAVEVIYACHYDDPFNPDTIDNYKLWLEMLKRDMQVYQTATADCHGQPKNGGMNCVYAKSGDCADIVPALRAGNTNSGCVAIQMALDNAPMGSRNVTGKTLTVAIKDANPVRFDPKDSYRVDIHTDRGIAYSTPLTMPFACAIETKDRKFYRVEVLRESDGAPMAIGNPIWCKGEGA